MRSLLKYTDIIVAALIIGIILIIVIPQPPTALDFLLIINLTISLIILLTTLFTTNVLQLSVFPTLLLVTTLLRLALNVSSTRLILSTGGAGRVIGAFGDFVIGANPVVGLVIFIIITAIQLVVITNGAGRVSEVAARFTLDAMPGKQMAVDADLNAGLINEEQARERRRSMQREADFYGSMDGASKFVKGDAIIGIIITLVNIVGGLIMGMVQLGMTFEGALNTYIILTVGNGLVSQLSALMISTASGILVTRSHSDNGFGTDLFQQLFSMPKVIGLVSVLLGGLGLVPQLPALPFLAMSGATGYAAFVLYNEEKEKAAAPPAPVTSRPAEPENVLSLISNEQMEIEIGFGLVRLTDGAQGGDLLDRLSAVRRRFMVDHGLFVRPIRIRDNLQLKPNQYVFKIRGNQVAIGELMPTHYLCMDYSGAEVDLPGIITSEPTFNLPAKWIADSDRERAELLGYTVVDSTTVMVTHLTEMSKRFAHELLGRQEVKEIVDRVREQQAAVIDELTTEQITIGDIQKVLQGLLQEGTPIRDLVTIFETIADNARLSKEPDFLLERVRQALSRTISRGLAEGGVVHVLTLSPRTEQQLLESLNNTGGAHIVLEPTKLHALFESLAKQAEKLGTQGKVPIILCPSRLRLPLRRLTIRHFPSLNFLAPGEVSNDVEIESLGAVTME